VGDRLVDDLFGALACHAQPKLNLDDEADFRSLFVRDQLTSGALAH
jgi:hypothetical protein